MKSLGDLVDWAKDETRPVIEIVYGGNEMTYFVVKHQTTGALLAANPLTTTAYPMLELAERLDFVKNLKRLGRILNATRDTSRAEIFNLGRVPGYVFQALDGSPVMIFSGANSTYVHLGHGTWATAGEQSYTLTNSKIGVLIDIQEVS